MPARSSHRCTGGPTGVVAQMGQGESKSMADLSDVSSIDYGDRLFHHLDNLGGKQPRRRAEVYELAHAQATGEMLDEIHTMLRHLCGIPDDQNGAG